MQFFPADITNVFAAPVSEQTASTAKNAVNDAVYSYADAKNGNNSFESVFNSSLQAFNENNTVGTPFGFRSVHDDGSKIKGQDLLNLKQILTNKGVSSDVVESFTAKLNTMFAGVTVGNIKGAATSMIERKSDPLNEQEALAFNALLSKLGFNEKDIEGFNLASLQGRGSDILDAIKKKIADSPETTLNLDEVALICRAADINGDDTLNILAGFGDKNELLFNEGMFNQLFGLTHAGMQQNLAEVVKLNQALPEAINEMLAMRTPEKNQPAANNKSNRLAERTAILAAEIATMVEDDDEDGNKLIRGKSAAARLMDNDAANIVASVAGQKNKTDKNSTQGQQADAVKANALTDAKGINNENPLNAMLKNNAQQNGTEKNAAMQNGQNNNGEQAGSESRSGSDAESNGNSRSFDLPFGSDKQTNLNDPKSVLASKIENVSGAFFMPQASGAENNSATQVNPQQAKTAYEHSSRIFDQVEKGLMRSMTDGSKQMVLRLDPPELGKLTLSLTMAQGEVKAVIRTESSATTQVISEQLAQLKQSLEEQGFKVASLEVETRTNQHAGSDHWNGTEQHNQQQEMQERSRFVRLARSRNSENEVLAQSMQHIEQPASISATGLHIIA